MIVSLTISRVLRRKLRTVFASDLRHSSIKSELVFILSAQNLYITFAIGSNKARLFCSFICQQNQPKLPVHDWIKAETDQNGALNRKRIEHDKVGKVP